MLIRLSDTIYDKGTVVGEWSAGDSLVAWKGMAEEKKHMPACRLTSLLGKQVAFLIDDTAEGAELAGEMVREEVEAEVEGETAEESDRV